jgi:glycosyltransferase involved in cell wall biosynthesis
VCTSPIAPRYGGVQVQLDARLRAERTMRNVALLHPHGLDLSAPRPHTRAMRGGFESTIHHALELTGAKLIHLEGTHNAPLDALLRLVSSGVRLIVTVHDFSLFCARPHLIELPHERFCDYSTDLTRCGRCLAFGSSGAPHDQLAHRALGRALLERATLIFPSRFLLEKHRQLFDLPLRDATLIEPSVSDAAAASNSNERPAIAYVGAVKRHKGAHLLPDLIRDDARWHIFGGGDEDLLRALRRMPNVTVHGYYRYRDVSLLLQRNRIGLVVLPSIWPETYSLVLSEAWLAGAAVVAFDHGAPADRIRRDGGGWLAPLPDGAAGLASLIDAWRAGRAVATIPRNLPMVFDAARAHVALYRAWSSEVAAAPDTLPPQSA